MNKENKEAEAARIIQQEDVAFGKGAPTGILKKLNRVLADVQYIQTDKRNNFHGYRYVSEATIKAKVQPSFVKHGIVPKFDVVDVKNAEWAPTNKGKQQWLTTVRMAWQLYDADSGDFLSGTCEGVGIDSEDKGLPKAITNAIKYMLSSNLLFATGDDPEAKDADREPEQEQDQGQRPQNTSNGNHQPSPAAGKVEPLDVARFRKALGKLCDGYLQTGGPVGVKRFERILASRGIESLETSPIDLTRPAARGLHADIVSDLEAYKKWAAEKAATPEAKAAEEFVNAVNPDATLDEHIDRGNIDDRPEEAAA